MNVGLSSGLDLYTRNSAAGFAAQTTGVGPDKPRRESTRAIPENLEITTDSTTDSTTVSISSEARLRAATETNAVAAGHALDKLQPPAWLTELAPIQNVPQQTPQPPVSIVAYADNTDTTAQAHAADVGEYSARLNQIYRSVLQSNQITTASAREAALADSQQNEALRSQVVKAIQSDARMMDLAITLRIPLAR